MKESQENKQEQSKLNHTSSKKNIQRQLFTSARENQSRSSQIHDHQQQQSENTQSIKYIDRDALQYEVDRSLFYARTSKDPGECQRFQKRAEYFQAKLNVSHPQDEQELEADRVAEQVMRMQDVNIEKSNSTDYIPRREQLGRLTPGRATPSIPLHIETRILRERDNRGVPLSDSSKDFFEPRFNADLSNIRIHNNSESNDLSKNINAKAFTMGNDIFFAPGQYDEQSSEGKKLMAHELTHTIQQKGKVQKKVQRAEEAVENQEEKAKEAYIQTALLSGNSYAKKTAMEIKNGDKLLIFGGKTSKKGHFGHAGSDGKTIYLNREALNYSNTSVLADYTAVLAKEGYILDHNQKKGNNPKSEENSLKSSSAQNILGDRYNREQLSYSVALEVLNGLENYQGLQGSSNFKNKVTLAAQGKFEEAGLSWVTGQDMGNAAALAATGVAIAASSGPAAPLVLAAFAIAGLAIFAYAYRKEIARFFEKVGNKIKKGVIWGTKKVVQGISWISSKISSLFSSDKKKNASDALDREYDEIQEHADSQNTGVRETGAPAGNKLSDNNKKPDKKPDKEPEKKPLWKKILAAIIAGLSFGSNFGSYFETRNSSRKKKHSRDKRHKPHFSVTTKNGDTFELIDGVLICTHSKNIENIGKRGYYDKNGEIQFEEQYKNEDYFKGKGDGVSTGLYKYVKGHHVHSKAAFKDHPNYNPSNGFSISQKFMKQNGWNHAKMTATQRKLFKELFNSGKPNTMKEHTRIAFEALKAGGVPEKIALNLIEQSLYNLLWQKVYEPTKIPWY